MNKIDDKTFETRQLSAYRTLSSGQSGCLFYVGLKEYRTIIDTPVPAVYLLDSPVRKSDKAPSINQLYDAEKEALSNQEPLLSGYGAWLVSKVNEGTHWRDYPSYETYLQKLEFNEYNYYQASTKQEELLEECFGKQLWHTISNQWKRELDRMITLQYTHPDLHTENEDFDYCKALFDYYWDREPGYPQCHIQLENNREVEVVGGIYGVATSLVCNNELFDVYQNEEDERFYNDDYRLENEEEEDNPHVLTKDECFELYDREANDYDCYGLPAALINLARNYRVYSFAKYESYKRQKWPDLLLRNFSFRFRVGTKQLLEAYLLRIEQDMIREEEQKIDVLDPDMDEIIRRLYYTEKYAAADFEESKLATMLSPEQKTIILTYCNTFEKLLFIKYGDVLTKLTNNPKKEIQDLFPEEGKTLLEIAQKHDLLDEHFMPVKLSSTNAAILADFIAEKIDLKNKWSVFEKLWNKKNMAQAYQKAAFTKKCEDFEKQLRRIFQA